MAKKTPGNITQDDFASLTAALANDLVNAIHHFDLHCRLDAEIPKYSTEFNQTRAFWSLTIKANLDTCIYRLCRVYDGNKDALHLSSWLESIRKNIHFFDKNNFRVRLKGNAFVDSLVNGARKPDATQLGKDIYFVSHTNPVVKKLTILRNNHFAHRNFDGASMRRNWLEEIPLTYREIRSLLETGLEIVNRYSILFKAESYSAKLIGDDDYLLLLKLISRGLAV